MNAKLRDEITEFLRSLKERHGWDTVVTHVVMGLTAIERREHNVPTDLCRDAVETILRVVSNLREMSVLLREGEGAHRIVWLEPPRKERDENE